MELELLELIGEYTLYMISLLTAFNQMAFKN